MALLGFIIRNDISADLSRMILCENLGWDCKINVSLSQIHAHKIVASNEINCEFLFLLSIMTKSNIHDCAYFK
jgi:hypothetical protein